MSDAEGIGGLGRKYHGRNDRMLTKINFLAGRLEAAMPWGTAAHQVGPESIMHGPEPLEQRSRAVLDSGDERFVIVAREDLEYCTENFVSDSQAIMRVWDPPAAISTVPGRGGVESVVGILRDPVEHTDFIQIATAYVRQPDTTVQTLNFIVSPNAAHDLEGVRLLVLGVLATLAPGPRRLETSAGVRQLTEPGDPFELRIAVPDGWVATLQHGPDFLVYQVERMSPFNGATAVFSFYVGHHPRVLPPPEPDDPIMPIFGEPRTWVRQREDHSDHHEKRELIVALPNERGLVYAIAVTNDPALWSELESIAASVTAPYS
ncbi:hypothetical protein [Nocardia crassostreae]|uniref:hypothetical protein n=1 Tax=Nocardia crassostreae TaxID=53428 RepID=UPI000831F6D1|nr:hypothetical protein [Nocardia crassostreae]